MNETHKSSCSISACCKPPYTKGYCRAHYARLLRHGDPLGGRTSPGELLRWVHDVALHHTGDECLAWPFCKDEHGYGRLWVSGKHVKATRYVCAIVNGPAPTGEHEAAHSCGKGHDGCIAPVHLEWKTPVENAADKLLHGTHNRGERCGTAKLTEPEAREILSLRGIESRRNLAERFMVSRATIGDIHTVRSWAWLSEEVAS
jgi:hypothetical protein